MDSICIPAGVVIRQEPYGDDERLSLVTIIPSYFADNNLQAADALEKLAHDLRKVAALGDGRY